MARIARTHRQAGVTFLFSFLLGGCAAGASGPGGGPSPAELQKQVRHQLAVRFQRIQVAHLPTPLEEMPSLSDDLGGPRILVKRDDQTGLAFGGNKARKLDFIFADALERGADVVITWGGLQSNWCRQTAAAASKLGMRSILLLSKRDEGPTVPDGNLLLDILLGAEVHILSQEEDPAEVAARIASEEEAAGNTPYVVSVGGSRTGGSMEEPLGAMGYLTAFLELHEQATKQGVVPDYLVVATGSGGTQAGLLLGAAVTGGRTKVVGISVSGSAEGIQRNVAQIATQTATAMDLGLTFSPDDVIVFDDYVGEGYGIMTDGTVDAIRRLARREGILLDPVYTGKAMSGLIDLARKGYLKPDDVVVFLHTGGTPAIFHYGEELLPHLGWK